MLQVASKTSEVFTNWLLLRAQASQLIATKLDCGYTFLRWEDLINKKAATFMAAPVNGDQGIYEDSQSGLTIAVFADNCDQ